MNCKNKIKGSGHSPDKQKKKKEPQTMAGRVLSSCFL